MFSSSSLEPLRATVRERLLPAYAPLGHLTLVYLLGSLISGYTNRADLDLMMVWQDPAVPAAHHRETVVIGLDERQGISPLVVDHLDVHLERFVIAEQEYNVAHLTLAEFETILQSILQAKRDDTERILDPLVATAAFLYGETVLDTDGLGALWKSKLTTFPPLVKHACRRVVVAHRQEYLAGLSTASQCGDWFTFSSTLLQAVRTTVRALFVLHGIYYPGDKYLRQAIVRFSLGEEVLTCFDRLWENEGNVEAQARAKLAAIERLLELVEEHRIDDHPGHEQAGRIHEGGLNAD